MKYFSAVWNNQKQQWEENGIALTANDARILRCTVEGIEYFFSCPTVHVKFRDEKEDFSHCEFVNLRQNSCYYRFLSFFAEKNLVKGLKSGDHIDATLIPTMRGNGEHCLEFTCIGIKT